MDKIIVNIELTVEQVNQLLNLLGELPTKTGIWPLLNYIQVQAQNQVNTVAQPSPESAPAPQETKA